MNLCEVQAEGMKRDCMENSPFFLLVFNVILKRIISIEDLLTFV